MSQVTSQPIFASGQKNQVWVGYFLGQVGSSQKILTGFAMFNHAKSFIVELTLAHEQSVWRSKVEKELEL